MKNYLLFAGSTYYPAGGMDDFRGDFDSKEEALSKLDERDEDGSRIIWHDWFHVYSLKDKNMVSYG